MSLINLVFVFLNFGGKNGTYILFKKHAVYTKIYVNVMNKNILSFTAKLIHSHLVNKTLPIKLDNILSNLFILQSGVPQGSVLASLKNSS